ncbi:decapping and exoribonuclease protein-like, partial [Rhipicephalus sanguineus]|uniref:decapping and exoribonuclease protein-like n=1 Tax=Rhipicephalus sanguineus TaxID=34632 RepID=UPI0020C540B6
ISAFTWTAEEPGAVPDDDELLRESEAYTVILRSKLGSHSIVLGAEVKAVDPSVECEPGSTASYVEFKVTRDQGGSTDARRESFKRHALLAWWAQCRLAGVPRALCGYRNEHGILVNIEDIDVNDMPKMAEGMWSEGKCMLFCDRLLSFIKQHVKVDDGRTVYLFEYIPRSREIVCKRLRDPGETYKPWGSLPEVFEGCGSVHTS